jgi:hypothetical protein
LNDAEQLFVVLGLIAENFELPLFEEKQAVGRSYFFGLVIDPRDLRINQFRHYQLAIITSSLLPIRRKFKFLYSPLDYVEFLAVLIESYHQPLEFSTCQCLPHNLVLANCHFLCDLLP